MSKNLLIVESPAKAKTIEGFLGKDFLVKSSYGHIRDLDKGKSGVNIEDDFEPKYVVSPEKAKVVKELKTAASKADEIWLATDEDREGEAISWHLCEVLKLNQSETKRIVFREITKPAIQNAIENPRRVNQDLVDAQQARRILDRLVGFELSEVLWRKVKNKLSAGRVQSVAVKLIVEREREIQQFDSKSFFKVTALFHVKDSQGNAIILKADLNRNIESEEEAQAFLEKCKNAGFKVRDIQVKPSQRKPSAPFITSTLQQEASRKLGFSVNRTMSAAQKLYEKGFITYMRTDSTSLSAQATQTIAAEITEQFGDAYLQVRKFKTKAAGAQEAHEAIRPSYVNQSSIDGERDIVRLYDLIWKRTIASQMSNARLEKTQVDISISSMPNEKLIAEGEVLKFDGFLKVYMESKDDDDNGEVKGMLPPITVGQDLSLKQIESGQRFSRPPARYTEASLVKKLEEMGIGRPSTYAPTITKIMELKRGYVTKESRDGVERQYSLIVLKDGEISKNIKTEITGTTKNRLYPSDIGILVSDFLSKHFEEIMNYGFTADIESKLDKIADGKVKWKDLLQNFYGPFHETVEETLDKSARAKGRRDLGVDPESGHTVLVQLTRFGPVVQIGTREEVGEDSKPKFANLQPGMSMETISFEEAMDMFQLPKKLGEYENEEIIVSSGRYGPYIKFKEQFISLPRGEDPLKFEMEGAIHLIEEKKKENAPIGTYQNLPITKGKGRFGPFLKWNELYVNVPKKYSLDDISMEQAIELIDKKVEKEANRYIQRWESEKISIENARWGPVVKFKRAFIKIPVIDGEKQTDEQLSKVSLDQVKEWIEAAKPGSFKKKKKKPSK
jgi:DNA topoisomerase-1